VKRLHVATVAVHLYALSMLTNCTCCGRMTVRVWKTGDADVRTWVCGGCDGELEMTGIGIEVKLTNEKGEVVE